VMQYDFNRYFSSELYPDGVALSLFSAMV